MALMFARNNVCVNTKGTELRILIAIRLKDERLRLGLTQELLAEAAGIKRRTLQDWERGLSTPPALQLSALGSVGFDVQYIITGQRQQSGIGEAAVYQAVLDAVDLLSLENKIDAAQLAKAVVKLVAKSMPAAQATAAGSITNTNSGEGAQLNFHASVENAIGRDATIVKGKKKP